MQAVTSVEHVGHIPHVSGLKAVDVQFGHAAAVKEERTHAGDFARVPAGEIGSIQLKCKCRAC